MIAHPSRFPFMGKDILLCAALCILSLLTFHPALSNNFAPIDDDIVFQANPHIREFSRNTLTWMFTNTSLTLRYAPLNWVLWTLVYVTMGPDPWGFHLLGIFFHLLNVILVYALIRSILSQMERLRNQPHSSRAAYFAALATAVWAVHPLRVEVVSWATIVHYGQAQAMGILMLLCYLRAARERVVPEVSRIVGADRTLSYMSASTVRPIALYRTRWFWISVGFYAISVLFYPSATLLPAILPFLDIYLFRRMTTGVGRSVMRQFVALCLEKIPYLCIASIIAIVTIHGRASSSAFWGTPATLAEFPLVQRVMQVAFVLTYYLWKPFDPTHISPYYNYLVSIDPASPLFLLSLFTVIALTLAAIFLHKRHPWFTLFWVAHLVIILPVCGYFDHPYMPGDRYAYFHDVLYAIAFAWALTWIWPRAGQLIKGIIPAAVIAMVLVFAFLSHAQSETWKSGETVFLNALAEIGPHPYQSELQWRLAQWYLEQRRPAEALDYANRAIDHGSTAPAAYAIKQKAQLALILTAQSQAAPPSPSPPPTASH